MTRDRARKKAIRARMAVSREPYSVAARKLDATPPPSDAAARAILARVNATLAAPSARFEYLRDTDVAAPERRQQARPGPAGRLARLAARAVWSRISPEVDAARFGEMLRETFRRQAGVGFVEPAAGRYQVDYGGYAQIYLDGELFGGPSGAPLRTGSGDRRVRQADNPLSLLRLLRDVKQAWYRGEETLHGTPCRAVAVQAGSDRFTVWIDDEHVRRIQTEWRGTGSRHGGSSKTTFELWEFGVPVDSLDWSRLPSLQEPG